MDTNETLPNFGRVIPFITAPVVLFFIYFNVAGDAGRAMLLKQLLDGIEQFLSPRNATSGMYSLCMAPCVLGALWFVARRWIASWEA